MRRKSLAGVRIQSTSQSHNPDSQIYRAADAAVAHGVGLLRALAEGKRSPEHARMMALAVMADAPRAVQLAARVQLQLDEPTDDAMRLAGLLAQLGSPSGSNVLREMSTGRWDRAAAERMVREVLSSAPTTAALAADVLLGEPHSWRRAIELADELTQRRRDAHARADRRSKIKGYAVAARETKGSP
jgi:hypothetical protein